MKKNFLSGKKVIISALSAIVFLAVLIACLSVNRSAAKELKNLSFEGCDSVFFSMFPTSYYEEEYFTVNIGVSPCIIHSKITKDSGINTIISKLNSSGEEISTVYIGFDPTIFKNPEDRPAMYDSLISYIDMSPDKQFEILFSYPSLSWWTGLSDKKYTETIQKYIITLTELTAKENCNVYFISAEEWLIANLSNFEKNPGTANPATTKNIILLTLCDGHFSVSPDNAGDALTALYDVTNSARAGLKSYTNRKDSYMLFIGDSVMAVDSANTSIPQVASFYTGAACANPSIGGIAASGDPASYTTFLTMADAIISGTHLEEYERFNNEVDKFHTDYLSKKNKYNNLYIFIEFGLNDYFSGKPLGDISDDYMTYAGALIAGIESLKQAYPEAVITLLTPNHVTEFDCGNSLQEPANVPLVEYSNVVKEIAEYEDCYVLDIYEKTEFPYEEYFTFLQDGVHPGFSGRYYIGREIADYLEVLK